MDSRSEKIKLCSQALARLNGPTISSFEDKTRESSICGILYEDLYRRALCASKWSFTLSYATLSADAGYKADSNSDIWHNRFILPSDCISVIGVRVPNTVTDPMAVPMWIESEAGSNKLNGYSTVYELRDNFIYANAKTVILDYQYRVAEAQLSHCPLFREYLVLLLASEFALPIMNDINKAQFFNQKATDAYYLASSSDTNQSPTQATSSSSTLVRMRVFG